MEHRPHEKLIVWQKSISLTEKIYKATKKFPREEIYGLISQMRRASVSVASNLAEGSARQTRAEFKQFVYLSRGSLSELETQLIISLRLGYISSEECKNLMQLTDEIGRMLTTLIKRLQ